jgi:hypothetical protein
MGRHVVSRVVFERDGIRVDATLIADAFRIPPQTVLERIRAGEIRTVSERGVDADAGRFRLTFFFGAGRLQLLIDSDGNVVKCSLLVAKPRSKPSLPPGASGAPGESAAETPRSVAAPVEHGAGGALPVTEG